MPIYEYQCKKCNYAFEQLSLRVGLEELNPKCPRCGRFFGERIHSVAHARFKGTGFYANDYRRKEKQNGN